MTRDNVMWLWLVVFAIAIIAVFATASQAAGNNILLLLNEVGEILKIDVDEGKILGKTYIPEAYYSNKILADRQVAHRSRWNPLQLRGLYQAREDHGLRG